MECVPRGFVELRVVECKIHGLEGAKPPTVVNWVRAFLTTCLGLATAPLDAGPAGWARAVFVALGRRSAPVAVAALACWAITILVAGISALAAAVPQTALAGRALGIGAALLAVIVNTHLVV